MMWCLGTAPTILDIFSVLLSTVICLESPFAFTQETMTSFQEAKLTCHNFPVYESSKKRKTIIFGKLWNAQITVLHRFAVFYSWIACQLEVGTTLTCLLSGSNFKSETSLGFLTSNYRGMLLDLFCKILKWSRSTSRRVGGVFQVFLGTKLTL